MPRPKAAPPKAPAIWPGALAIIVLLLVVYFPSLRGEFLFDDTLTILRNELIVLPGGLSAIWFSTRPLDYFPLTLSSFWIEWRLWGMETLNYHLLNLFLHAASAVVLWRILSRLKIPGAWLAAVVFAVHPLCVTSVAWITERKNTLSMVFFLLAILMFLRFEGESENSPKRRRLYWISLGIFLLALLSKTSVVMLPVVLLGLAWWQRGFISRKDIFRSVPFFALSLIMGLVTLWFQHHRASGGETASPMAFAERLAGAGWAPWFYLFKSLLPAKLAMFYPEWKIEAGSLLAYVPGILLVLVFAVLWWFRKTPARHALFALGYFVVMLFPVLGFFDMFFFYYSRVADHFAYLAVIGIIVLVIGGATHCARQFKAGKYFGQARLAAVLLVLVFSVMSWREAAAFKDEESLWRATLKSNPQSWAAYNNLGIVVEDKGRMEEAEDLYRKALEIKPDFDRAYFNLGILYEKQGRLNKAFDAYHEALRIQPNEPHVLHNLANILSRQGKVDEAIETYQASLKLQPKFDHAHYSIALAFEKAGRFTEAISHLKTSLEITPDFEDAKELLKELLGKSEKQTTP